MSNGPANAGALTEQHNYTAFILLLFYLTLLHLTEVLNNLMPASTLIYFSSPLFTIPEPTS